MKPPYWVPPLYVLLAVAAYKLESPGLALLITACAAWALFSAIRCIEKLTR